MLPHEIQDRRFATAFRGYDPTEVRQFLTHIAGLYGDLQAQLSRGGVGVPVPDRAELAPRRPRVDDVFDGLAVDGLAVDNEGDNEGDNESVDQTVDEKHDAADAAKTWVDAQRQADDLLSGARAEAQTIVSRASDEAARIVLRARAESRGKPSAERNAAIEAALAEIPGDPEQAREQARLMISEARAVRERILGDLAKRRRTAHIQLEQLRVAREKLLETLRDARRVVEEASRDLSTAEVEARLAAETAGRRVANEAMPGVEELEAELFVGRYAVSPSTMTVAGVPAVDLSETAGSANELVVESMVEVVELQMVSVVEVTTIEEILTVDPASEPADQATVVGDITAPTERAAPTEPAEPAGAAGPRVAVDDLFARLRAERTEAADQARAVLAATEPAKTKRSRASKKSPPGEDDAVDAVDAMATSSPQVIIDVTKAVTNDREFSATADLGRDAADIEALVAQRLARSIKRHLSDEQGGALVAVRTARGLPHIDAMVGTSDEQRARLADVVALILEGAPEHPAAEFADVVDAVAGEVRTTLGAALDRLAIGTLSMADLPEAIAAAYRVWTTERLDAALRRMAHSAA